MAKLINLAKVDKLSKDQQRRFLASHPAKQAALPKNVDRGMFGHGSSNETAAQADLSQLTEGILANYGSKSASDRLENWAAAKKKDTERFFAQNSDAARKAVSRRQRQALFLTLENLFTNFRRLAFHYNKFTAGTELFVSESPLVEVMEPLQINKFGQIESSVTYIRTRFSTSLSSLTIRGCTDKIEFFIVPTSLVMALSKVEDQMTPVVTVKVLSDSQPVSWEVNNCWGNPEHEAEEFTMWLFDQLIEHSKASLDPQSAITGKCLDASQTGYIGKDEILPNQTYKTTNSTAADLLSPIFEPMEQHNTHVLSAYSDFGRRPASNGFVECGNFESTVGSVPSDLLSCEPTPQPLEAASVDPVKFDYKKAWWG